VGIGRDLAAQRLELAPEKFLLPAHQPVKRQQLERDGHGDQRQPQRDAELYAHGKVEQRDGYSA